MSGLKENETRGNTVTYHYRTKYLSWLRSNESFPDNACVPSSLLVPTSQRMFRLAKEATIDLAAGTAGATVSVYAGQPMDTVKVKMQAFPHLHKNMVPCFVETLKKEGVKGLYAGTIPALMANIAENSVLFAAYGMCQKGVAYAAAAKSPDDLSSLGNATAGFFAAFFSSFTLCPTELVKCRMQAMQELKATQGINIGKITPWSVTRHIMRTEGLPGMFCGLTSTIAREMPGYFFFFGGYEFTRSLLVKEGESKDDIGHVNTFISGGMAGVTLWTAMFPTDVLKSRIQVMGSKTPMLEMAKIIYRNEGIGAFYNGLKPTLIRTFPATGLLLVTYETVKRHLRDVVS